MERLTKEDILKFPETAYGRMLGKTLANQVVSELLQYKALEEEIGCPLEVMAKASLYGVYVLDEKTGGVKHILRGWCNKTQDYSYENIGAGFIDDRFWCRKIDEETGLELAVFYAWKDYKKTWWLREDKSE